jgi:hypothetical protein
MYDYYVPDEDIASKFNRSVDYVRRVSDNEASRPDSVEKDYDYVDEETKELYPQMVSEVVL